MADTLKFGPEWLRQLSSGGSMTSPPASPSFGGKYKLADNRYGREEMLALFTPNPKAPDDLRQFTSILVDRCQDPMAMIAPTEEEQRLLASNVNSNAAFRQMMSRSGGPESGPPGMRGAGRGGLSSRGRGRGRGEPSGFYRGGFDDPLSGRGETSRGRGGREGGATKVIERDSSGFLSARTFDENTDRQRIKDPYSRSIPSGDRWSELRQSGREPTARSSWRDAKPSFDDESSPRYQRAGGGGFNRQISYDRSRSHRQDEDELPEWATDDMGGGDEGGTFDSSGAFLLSKDAAADTSQQNGDQLAAKRDRKQAIDKVKKSLPPLNVKLQAQSTSQSAADAASHNTDHTLTTPSTTDKDRAPSSNTKASTAQVDDKHSTDIPSNRNTERGGSESTTAPSDSVSHTRHIGSKKKTAEPEADFDHLTKAAEEMMATWAAEDDDHPPSTANPILNDSPVVNRSDSPVMTDPALADKWFYKDPQGTLQGPFTSQEMAEWFSAGYFTLNLLVKRGSDRTFQPLGEIIKRCGGGVPFVPVTPSTAGSVLNPLGGAADPSLLVGAQDPRAIQQQQQMVLLQQQLLQQQQQMALIRQQQQLQQIIQTLGTSEEYSALTPQQLQTVAMSILVKEQQKQQQVLLQQQAAAQHILLEAGRSKPPVNQQSSPPQQQALNAAAVTGVSKGPGTPTQMAPGADDDMLWGAANRSWKQQMMERQAVEEIAQKEAARQQEQQRLDMERQRERELQLIEEQRLLEQKRIQEETAKEEIRLQREEMEKRMRELEERKRQDIERQDMERKRQKEKQLEMERQREMERQKQLEMERQKEVEKKMAQEAKRKSEQQRQREEEEKRQLEAEMARRTEQQRQEMERGERERQAAERERERERDRQAERERLDALQLPSTAQWGSNSNVGQATTFDRQLSLQEIQKNEKEQADKDRATKAAAERQRQQELQEQNLQQTQLKWAATKSQSPVTVSKSLREIQEEEARRLEKEKKERQKQKTATMATVPMGTAATWAGSKPIAVTGWANEGAWGNAVRKGTWEQPNNKPAKAANSEIFPSLSAATKSQTTSGAAGTGASQQVKKKQTNSAQNAKKIAQNEKVKKLFQNTASSDDKFTDWCTKSLQGINSSIDVPTFISFLRDVDSPYEVQDYVNSYLGETPKSSQFAKEFIERRSIANKKKLAQQKLDDEESLWGPAPAVNPSTQRVPGGAADPASAAITADKKKKPIKKTKGQKMDATALLGFTVGASSHRLNIGEIEKAE